MKAPDRTGSRNYVTQKGRPRDEARRAQIREAAADVLLERGLFATSLEDLARATGVSSRMLVHHFGSKDGLLIAALEEARGRQLAAADEHLQAAPVRSLRDLLVVIWTFLSAPESQPHLRLFGEVAAAAAQNPDRFPGFAQATVHDWLPRLEFALIAGGESPATARSYATLAFAIERGLMLDRSATNDDVRTRDAHELLLRLLGTDPH